LKQGAACGTSYPRRAGLRCCSTARLAFALSAGNHAGAASAQPHGPIHLKKSQVSGYDRPVSWIYVFIAFRQGGAKASSDAPAVAALRKWLVAAGRLAKTKFPAYLSANPS
jgi:hypothetical protein